MHPTQSDLAARHFDSIEQEAFLNLWRTYDRMHMAEEELFGRYELTPQQYNVLRLLRANQPEKLPTLALAARLVSRAPDITRMLDKLEARQLVARQRPADNRRVVLVGITEPGVELLKELDAQIQACHLRQFGHMPPEDLQRLIALLYEARRPHEEPGSTWL